jgi:hypothetical protein
LPYFIPSAFLKEYQRWWGIKRDRKIHSFHPKAQESIGRGPEMDTVTRRSFVAKVGGIVATSFFISSTGLAEEARAPREQGQKAKGQGTIEVSPVEDLMREHGILSRCLLIYEEMTARMEKEKKVAPGPRAATADLIRRFIEEYHEKLEEAHIFPRFVKAGKLADLVKILQE